MPRPGIRCCATRWLHARSAGWRRTSIIELACLNISIQIAGTRFELNAIAAVTIGGISLNGGRRSVIGTLIGALIIGALANGLILVGLTDFMRQMITGLLMITAVILDHCRARLSAPCSLHRF